MGSLTKFTDVQNWLGKAILMFIATIWLSSSVYPHILKGFLLTDKDIPEWELLGSGGAVLCVTSLMILGGVYLNTLLEFFKSKFTK